MRSLRWKLGGALLLMVAISIGLMAYFTNLGTAREFGVYLSQGNQRYQQNTAAALSRLHARDGTWANVQPLLVGLLRSADERLVVADASGSVVGDTAGQWLGQSATDAGLTGGVTVAVAGRNVGELYTFLTQAGSGGRGNQGGGRGGGPPVSVPAQTNSEQDFLGRANRWLLITGIVAGIVALAIGLLLTSLITKPVRALTTGARRIARGDLSHRVAVNSRDELGDMGESFNAMAASLEDAEKERRRMVADIAHELRTPVTIIEGTVDGIQDGVFKADNERLAVIKEQTSLLTRLTEDLRDLSLVESGQLKLMITSADMVEIIRRKVTQLGAHAGARGVSMHLDLPERPRNVDVDPARIEQVLTNLLTNAIRHTPSGGRITASLREDRTAAVTGKTRPGIVVSVADTGEGINPEHLPHVFERFYRVQTSRSRSEGGAGLGLAIVKRMVEAHGGRVWVESQPGNGSTFYFAIPG